MPGHWGEIPLAAVILCLVSGIGLGSIVTQYYFALLVLGSVSLVCAGSMALLRNRWAVSRAAGLATIILAGLMLALAQRDGRSDADVRVLLSQGLLPLNEAVAFDACAAGDSEKRGTEAVTTIDLHGFRGNNGWKSATGKALLWMPGSVDGEESAPALSLKEGDRIRGWATWKLPRNYLNPGSADRIAYLARRGVFILGSVKSQRLLEVLPGDCSNWWMRLAGSVRGRVRQCLEPIRQKGRSQAAAILASLIIGDYSGLDTATREAFQNAGVYHVLVVSGLHVAWIAGVLLYLMQMCRVPPGAARLTVAVITCLYARVVGFQASITRCLWMFIFYLAGQALFRRALPANILLAAGVCFLAAWPNSLFDGGFQLSFLSVLAISLTALPVAANCLKPLTEPVSLGREIRAPFSTAGRLGAPGPQASGASRADGGSLHRSEPYPSRPRSPMLLQDRRQELLCPGRHAGDLDRSTALDRTSPGKQLQPIELDFTGREPRHSSLFFTGTGCRNYLGIRTAQLVHRRITCHTCSLAGRMDARADKTHCGISPRLAAVPDAILLVGDGRNPTPLYLFAVPPPGTLDSLFLCRSPPGLSCLRGSSGN